MKIETKIGLSLRVLALCLMTICSAMAQTTDNRSPYSRYAYGTQSAGYTAGARALGGMSAGLRDAMVTNPGNPASYTAVDSMTFIFDLGLSARYGSLSEGGKSDSRLLGNLDYLTVIYPMGRRMAMSAGILPYFSTGYSFGSQAKVQGDSNNDSFVRSYSGNGSYNQLYVGLAGRVFAGLNIGLNGAFVFGHTQHQRQIIYSTPKALNRIDNYNLHLKGFRLDVGLQYELALDSVKGRSLVLGGTYSPGFAFKSELTNTSYNQVNGTNSSSTPEVQSIPGEYTMPDQMSFGVSMRRKEHYMYGVDIKYSPWTKVKFSNNPAQFQDAWRVALAGEWTPDSRARNPWKRSRYRAGLSWGNSYIKIPFGDKTSQYAGYHEYGASVGLALPLVDRRSALNFSIDYKWLRPQQSGMITEQYIGFGVGITFNEGWFRKARVN